MKLHPAAILFDMDGVLVDSSESWYKALNGALKKFGQEEITREVFENTYWGDDLEEILKRMGLDLRIASSCISLYPNYTNAVKLFPDTKIALEKLRHYKKGIVTNTPYNCTQQIVASFGIAKYFKTIVTSDLVKMGKPYPDMLFKACADLGVEPTDVVLIGDTPIDVKAGAAAGCNVIGVGVEADFTIKTLSELPDMFVLP